MKIIYLTLLLFSITEALCQQNNDGENLSKIARSEQVGKYIIFSQAWLLDQYSLFKRRPELKEESTKVFMNNAFKNKCEWDIASIDPELRSIYERECEWIKMKEDLFHKYPTLNTKENFSLMITEATQVNSYYLNSPISNQHEYLKKNKN